VSLLLNPVNIDLALVVPGQQLLVVVEVFRGQLLVTPVQGHSSGHGRAAGEFWGAGGLRDGLCG
jgi:hypothetical protein